MSAQSAALAFYFLAGLAAAALALLFARMASFYQQSSGERTRARSFGLPAVLLATAGLLSALRWDEGAALLWLAGGGSLIALAFNLYRQMTEKSR